MASCQNCSVTLSRRNQSGFCRKCFSRCKPVTDETREAISAGKKRHLQANPEYAEWLKKQARKASQSPAAVKARTDRWVRERLWEKGAQARRDPEVAKRAGRSLTASRLAWCPPHLRSAYLDLVNVKRLKAAEAREVILEQDRREVERLRQRMNYQEPTPEPKGQPGRPAAWADCPEHLRPEYDRLRRKMPALQARRMVETEQCR